jgi:AAA domain
MTFRSECAPWAASSRWRPFSPEDDVLIRQLTLHQLAAALGGEVRGNEVLCPGPGHSSIDKSLSVKLDPNAPEGFLVHSFSRDDPIICRDHVRTKCGWPAFKANGRRPAFSSEEIQKRVRATAMAQVQTPKRFPSATYPYVDADCTLLYQVLRYDNPKTFLQRRPNGNGWIWEAGAKRVLYRFPEVLKYPDATVFLTEGEKDADRVAELGHCATTVASGEWTPECVQALRDRDVLILEDNDDAGRKKAFDAATRLHAVAGSIRIVKLPGLPEAGDVSDWLEAGHNADELVETCFATPLWSPAQSSNMDIAPATASMAAQAVSEGGEPSSPSSSDMPLPFINVLAWHGHPVPDREWCVLNRIPMRNVTLFSGEGAIGKSIVSLQLSVAHVLGKDWLGSLPEFGPAMVVCCEDDENELPAA